MKIDSDMLYGPCPCGSGSKFKFCCWPKCRDRIDGDMTKAEIVQVVRCEAAGVYSRTNLVESRIVDESGNVVGGLPEGVIELKDEDRLPILPPMPKWRMEYEISEVNELEDDVNAIVERLVRPYAERYCSIDGHEEIAILIIRLRRGKLPSDCPSMENCTYSQFWDALRTKLEELLEWQPHGTIACEVKYDQMYGGPMLSIENDKGDVELFAIAHPHHFGEDF